MWKDKRQRPKAHIINKRSAIYTQYYEENPGRQTRNVVFCDKYSYSSHIFIFIIIFKEIRLFHLRTFLCLFLFLLSIHVQSHWAWIDFTIQCDYEKNSTLSQFTVIQTENILTHFSLYLNVVSLNLFFTGSSQGLVKIHIILLLLSCLFTFHNLSAAAAICTVYIYS